MTAQPSEDLLERAESDPGTVHPDALVALVEDVAVDEDAVARALRSVLETDPDEDAVAAAVDRLASLTRADDMLVRDAAVRQLAVVADVRPAQVEPLVDDLTAILEDEFAIAHANALLTLENLAATRPAAVADAVPAVAALIETDEPLVQARAVECLATVADGRPALVDPAVPSLAAMLADVTNPEAVEGVPDHLRSELAAERQNRATVRETAAVLLADNAARLDLRPEQTVPSLRSVVADDANLVVRRAACRVLWTVAGDRPDAAMPAADALVAALADAGTETDPEADLGALSARTLALLADRDPDALDGVEAALPTLFALLTDERDEARAAAAGLLSYVAETDPGAVASRADALRDRLTDENPRVRAGVAFALGAAAVADAAPALKEVAESDPDDDVRAAARAALDRLEAT